MAHMYEYNMSSALRGALFQLSIAQPRSAVSPDLTLFVDAPDSPASSAHSQSCRAEPSAA